MSGSTGMTMITDQRTGRTRGTLGTPEQRTAHGTVTDDMSIPFGAVMIHSEGARWVYFGSVRGRHAMAREVSDEGDQIPQVWTCETTSMMLREFPGSRMYLRPEAARP